MTFNHPPVGSNGLSPRNGLLWNGHKWGNNSAQTWNTKAPYAVGLCENPEALRFELHDTPWDHGSGDEKIGESFKRRAEIGSEDKFKNGVDYWLYYAFLPDLDILPAGLTLRTSQTHWPSGASPANGDTILAQKGALMFRTTIKTDTSESITMATVPSANRQVHHVVKHFRLGASGFLQTWFDGKPIVDFKGQIGSTKLDGYPLRFGLYGVLKGAKAVATYANLSAFPSSEDLSALIANPPPFPVL
jgi:hypothetical protein